MNIKNIGCPGSLYTKPISETACVNGLIAITNGHFVNVRDLGSNLSFGIDIVNNSRTDQALHFIVSDVNLSEDGLLITYTDNTVQLIGMIEIYRLRDRNVLNTVADKTSVKLTATLGDNVISISTNGITSAKMGGNYNESQTINLVEDIVKPDEVVIARVIADELRIVTMSRSASGINNVRVIAVGYDAEGVFELTLNTKLNLTNTHLDPNVLENFGIVVDGDYIYVPGAKGTRTLMLVINMVNATVNVNKISLAYTPHAGHIRNSIAPDGGRFEFTLDDLGNELITTRFIIEIPTVFKPTDVSAVVEYGSDILTGAGVITSYSEEAITDIATHTIVYNADGSHNANFLGMLTSDVPVAVFDLNVYTITPDGYVNTYGSDGKYKGSATYTSDFVDAKVPNICNKVGMVCEMYSEGYSSTLDLVNTGSNTVVIIPTEKTVSIGTAAASEVITNTLNGVATLNTPNVTIHNLELVVMSLMDVDLVKVEDVDFRVEDVIDFKTSSYISYTLNSTDSHIRLVGVLKVTRFGNFTNKVVGSLNNNYDDMYSHCTNSVPLMSTGDTLRVIFGYNGYLMCAETADFVTWLDDVYLLYIGGAAIPINYFTVAESKLQVILNKNVPEVHVFDINLMVANPEADTSKGAIPFVALSSMYTKSLCDGESYIYVAYSHILSGSLIVSIHDAEGNIKDSGLVESKTDNTILEVISDLSSGEIIIRQKFGNIVVAPDYSNKRMGNTTLSFRNLGDTFSTYLVDSYNSCSISGFNNTQRGAIRQSERAVVGNVMIRNFNRVDYSVDPVSPIELNGVTRNLVSVDEFNTLYNTGTDEVTAVSRVIDGDTVHMGNGGFTFTLNGTVYHISDDDRRVARTINDGDDFNTLDPYSFNSLDSSHKVVKTILSEENDCIICMTSSDSSKMYSGAFILYESPTGLVVRDLAELSHNNNLMVGNIKITSGKIEATLAGTEYYGSTLKARILEVSFSSDIIITSIRTWEIENDGQSEFSGLLCNNEPEIASSDSAHENLHLFRSDGKLLTLPSDGGPSYELNLTDDMYGYDPKFQFVRFIGIGNSASTMIAEFIDTDTGKIRVDLSVGINLEIDTHTTGTPMVFTMEANPIKIDSYYGGEVLTLPTIDIGKSIIISGNIIDSDGQTTIWGYSISLSAGKVLPMTNLSDLHFNILKTISVSGVGSRPIVSIGEDYLSIQYDNKFEVYAYSFDPDGNIEVATNPSHRVYQDTNDGKLLEFDKVIFHLDLLGLISGNEMYIVEIDKERPLNGSIGTDRWIIDSGDFFIASDGMVGEINNTITLFSEELVLMESGEDIPTISGYCIDGKYDNIYFYDLYGRIYKYDMLSRTIVDIHLRYNSVYGMAVTTQAELIILTDTGVWSLYGNTTRKLFDDITDFDISTIKENSMTANTYMMDNIYEAYTRRIQFTANGKLVVDNVIVEDVPDGIHNVVATGDVDVLLALDANRAIHQINIVDGVVNIVENANIIVDGSVSVIAALADYVFIATSEVGVKPRLNVFEVVSTNYITGLLDILIEPVVVYVGEVDDVITNMTTATTGIITYTINDLTRYIYDLETKVSTLDVSVL